VTGGWLTEKAKPSHEHLGESRERLSLHVLNTLPASMDIPLVPEHIETRQLYNSLQPGIEQVRSLYADRRRMR